MHKFNPELQTVDLMKIAAADRAKTVELTDTERDQLFALLKERALQELDYGEELEVDTVKLIRRVTGAVGIYFD